jgi:lysophospholipase L1-like esterase
MPHRIPGSPRSTKVRALLAGASLTALLAGAGLLAGILPASAASTTGHRPPPVYYLALGDSLSQGVQPATPPLPAGVALGQSIETDQGYANDLDAYYSPAVRGGLRLVKLGCPGETSTSMLTGAGSPCSYPQGSQLAAAVAFIRAHQGEIGLITVDIGANDVDGCVTDGAISQTCVASGVAAIGSDVPKIYAALRAAAGGRVTIAGMNLYDPFLADYLAGPAGQAAATQSVTLAESVNTLLAAAGKPFGVRTADVQDAFSTADFTSTATLPGVGTVPLNVARICTWTWMCAPAPVGPNIHANPVGYRVIAAAFVRAIGRFPGYQH